MAPTQAIRVLNGLIRICRDNELLCGTGSRLAGRDTLRALLRHRCKDWARHADELQALVLMMNGEPVTSASAYTRARLAWLGGKGSLPGSNELTLLEVLEAAQQLANDRYAEALELDLPARIQRTVSQHAESLAEKTERLRLLRGQYAIHSEEVERV